MSSEAPLAAAAAEWSRASSDDESHGDTGDGEGPRESDQALLTAMAARGRRYSTPPPRRLARHEHEAAVPRGDSLRDMRAALDSPQMVSVQLKESQLDDLLHENGGPSDVLRRLARAGTVISPLPMRMRMQRRESEELSVHEPEEPDGTAMSPIPVPSDDGFVSDDDDDDDDDEDDGEEWSVVNRLALQHRIKPVAVSVPGEHAEATGQPAEDAAALPPPMPLQRPPSTRKPTPPDESTPSTSPEESAPSTPPDESTPSTPPEESTSTPPPSDDGVIMRPNAARRAEILKARRGVRLGTTSPGSSPASPAPTLATAGRASSATMDKPPPAVLMRQRSRTSVSEDVRQREMQDKITSMFHEENSKKRKPSKVFIQQMAALDESVPSKQGFLVKQGGKVKSWKCRWFVLTELVLFYYPDPEAIASGKALGAIPLVGATVQRCMEPKIKREFCFTLNTLQRRYYIHAESEEAMLDWMAAIRAKVNGSAWDGTVRMEGRVRCHIIEAKDVCAKDVSGTSDPFCVLLLDGTLRRTETQPKTLAPVWNEEFIFDTIHASSCLYVTMWDSNQFSKPVFMGQCAVAISDVIKQKRVATWLTLRTRGKKERVGGALHVELEYLGASGEELLPGIPKVFGRPLEELLAQEGRDVPLFVHEAVTYLRTHALDLEGLFRVPGRAFEIKLLKRCVDLGDYSWTASYDDAHIMGGMLKLYFRELPEPLLGFDLYDDFLAVPRTTDDEQIRMALYTTLIARLSPQRRHLLFYLLDFLATVAEHADNNRMSGGNLAIVFGPNLLRPRVESTDSLFQVMETAAIFGQLIRQYATIRDRLEQATTSPFPV